MKYAILSDRKGDTSMKTDTYILTVSRIELSSVYFQSDRPIVTPPASLVSLSFKPYMDDIFKGCTRVEESICSYSYDSTDYHLSQLKAVCTSVGDYLLTRWEENIYRLTLARSGKHEDKRLDESSLSFLKDKDMKLTITVYSL